jgi:hypothetical protein
MNATAGLAAARAISGASYRRTRSRRGNPKKSASCHGFQLVDAFMRQSEAGLADAIGPVKRWLEFEGPFDVARFLGSSPANLSLAASFLIFVTGGKCIEQIYNTEKAPPELGT